MNVTLAAQVTETTSVTSHRWRAILPHVSSAIWLSNMPPSTDAKGQP